MLQNMWTIKKKYTEKHIEKHVAETYFLVLFGIIKRKNIKYKREKRKEKREKRKTFNIKHKT